MSGKVYLIPTVLHEDEKSLQAIPSYIKDAIQDCDSFFVENERTARRYFKKIWKEMVIDDYFWMPIHKIEKGTVDEFVKKLKQGKKIGIVSEAGCPGIADPGQLLIEKAQQNNAVVIPLAGPNAMLLALMASGMNGQRYEFLGYLPIEASERKKAIKQAENYSASRNCTMIFIETPYRNNALIAEIISTSDPSTRLCVAVDITSSKEYIKTKTIQEWKKSVPNLHKRQAVFLLYAGSH